MRIGLLVSSPPPCRDRTNRAERRTPSFGPPPKPLKTSQALLDYAPCGAAPPGHRRVTPLYPNIIRAQRFRQVPWQPGRSRLGYPAWISLACYIVPPAGLGGRRREQQNGD